MTLFEFADIIDKQLVVVRYPNQNNRYTAHFENCETKEGSILSADYGDSSTPDLALEDYAIKISGKRLVFNAGQPNYRQEYVAPKLFIIP